MKLRNSESGHALLLVLVIMQVLLVLGTALLFSLSSEIKMQENSQQQAIATYLSQAGLEHGLCLLENAPANTTPDFPSSAVPVFSQGSTVHEYQIKKTGSVIESAGRIKVNGSTVKEVIIKATIDANGIVSIQRQQ